MILVCINFMETWAKGINMLLSCSHKFVGTFLVHFDSHWIIQRPLIYIYVSIYIYIYIKSKETTNKSEDALERFGDVVVNVLCFVFLFFGWFSGSLVAWLFGCLVPCLFYCFLFCSCC